MTNNRVVLVTDSFFDGERLHTGSVALEVVDGHVASVEDVSAQALLGDSDAVRLPEGSSLIPGFVDAHVHMVWDGSGDPMASVRETSPDRIVTAVRERTRRMLREGITACRDVGGPRAILEPARQSDLDGRGDLGSAVFASFEPLTAPGGHLHELGRPVVSAHEAVEAVQAHARDGADLVKLMVTGGIYGVDESPHAVQLAPDVIRASVDTAHDHGLLVAAHAQGDEGIRIAVDAGVDTIEHGIFASKGTLARMADRGTVLVPTLAVMDRIASSEDSPPYAREKARQVLDRHRRAAKDAIDLGVGIAVGTDMWSPLTGVDAYADEVERLGQLGLKGVDLLRAATSSAAGCISRDAPAGRLSVGAPADMLIVDGGIDHLTALPAVKGIYRAGVQINVEPSAS